jgi:hypothetical protein
VCVCANEIPTFDILCDMMLLLSLMTNAINGVHYWRPLMETINAVINGHH